MTNTFSSFRFVLLSSLFIIQLNSILLSQNYWERTSGPGTAVVYDFLFKDDFILIATWIGGMYKSTDGGESWQHMENEFSHSSVYALKLLSNGNILAGTESGIHISSDNGETWFYSALPDYPVSTITIDETDSIYIGSYYEYDIYRSGDNGIHWHSLNSGIFGVRSITIKNLNTILVSTNDRIYRSTDRGISWTQVFATNLFSQAIDITFNQSGNFAAISDFAGIFYLSTDEGITWDSVSTLPYSRARKIYSYSYGDYLVGSYGVFRSSDEGQTWLQLDGFQGSGVVRSIAKSGNSFYAGTYFTGVFRSTDSGNNWFQSSNGINHSTVSLLSKDYDGNIYAVSVQAGLSSTTDNGENWEILSAMSTLNSLSASPNGYLFGGIGSATTGVILRSSDSGHTWERIYENYDDTTVIQVIVNFDASVYALIAHKLFKSTNNGDSWFHVEVASPNEFINKIIINNIGYLYVQSSSDYFRSSDNGETWVGLTSTPGGLNIFGISKSDEMYATASDSGFYRSTDFGDIWNYIYKGNGQTVRSFADNDLGYLFILLPGAGILRSTDNGLSWQEINSGLEGISIYCLIITDDDYLIASTGGKGVYRSVNKTTSVENSFVELPNTILLDQNYPNPFNPTTKIRYQVPQNSKVSLKVFDVLGKEIATLVDEYKSAGVYEVEFSAKGGSTSDGDGSGLSSGIYFYQLNTGESVHTKKMILLK